MANVYYEAGPKRAEKVNDLFAAIAPRYDRINDLQSLGLHRWWKRRLVRLAQPKPGCKALDLCCGTGDVAFALARAGAEVVGLDFSEPMLQVARQRAGAEVKFQHGNPRFLQGDAMEIPFPDASFDIVTVSYGLRNLASWERGLEEMFRLAKPGGRLVILDFGKPDFVPWRWAYFAYLRFIVPVFGRIFCRDAHAYGYILESLQKYPAQRGVDAGLRKLGGRDVRLHSLLGGVMSLNVATKP